MPLNHDELEKTFIKALKSYSLDAPVEASPMQLLAQLSGSRAEQVECFDCLLSRSEAFPEKANLRKIFWWEKFSRQTITEAQFIENNPIAWLLSIADEANSDDRQMVISAIQHLLWNHAQQIKQLLQPDHRIANASHDKHMATLFNLLERVFDAMRLDDEIQIQLYNLYNANLYNVGVLQIVRRFEEAKLTGETLIRLLCPIGNTSFFPLLAEHASYFWDVLEKAYLQGRLDIDQFIKLRKKWVQITNLSAEQVNLLNSKSLNFVRNQQRQNQQGFKIFFSADAFFISPAFIQESDLARQPQHIDLSAAAPFYTSLLHYFSTWSLFGIENRQPLDKNVLLTALLVMLPNPNANQTISYLQLLKIFINQGLISYQDVYECIINQFFPSHSNDSIRRLPKQWQIYLVRSYGDAYPRFIEAFRLRQDELCAALLAMSNGPEKQQAVIEALTPDTPLQRLFTNPGNITALLEELRKPDYKGDQLLSLICNYKSHSRENMVLLYEIKKRCLDKIINYLEDPNNAEQLCYALDPDTPTYQFIALTPNYSFKYDNDELNALRKKHPEILLKILREGGFRRDHLHFLAVAKEELVDYITRLSNDEVKQKLFVEILNDEAYGHTALAVFFHDITEGKYIDKLIKNNLSVVIQIIISGTLSPEVLKRVMNKPHEELASFICQQAQSTEAARHWLDIATRSSNPLHDFLFSVEDSREITRARRSSLAALITARQELHDSSSEPFIISPASSAPGRH